MEHYFTRHPRSSEDSYLIEERLKGRVFHFKTSRSVFSKDKVDYGTRLLIETVDLEESDEILDLGCGYGPIGIALSPLCRFSLMVDLNERACRLAKENVSLNALKNAYVVCGSPSCLDYAFDLVAMNPPIRAGKRVVFQLIEEAQRLLKKKGRLYVVARTHQGARGIHAFMGGRFDVRYAALQGGYRVIEGVTT